MERHDAVMSAMQALVSEKNRIMGDALRDIRPEAPETTPALEQIDARIGTSQYFHVMENALEMLNREDISDYWENFKDAYMEDSTLEEKEDFRELLSGRQEIDFDLYTNYEVCLRALLYHYLEHAIDPRLIYDSPPAAIHRPFAMMKAALEYSDYEWGAQASDWKNTQGRANSIVWMYYFPDEEIGATEQAVREAVSGYEIPNPLADALVDFPRAFNEHTGKPVDAAEPDTSFAMFREYFNHELTHQYLRRRGIDNRIGILDEAFAQFTGKYFVDGLDFQHSKMDYTGYRGTHDIEKLYWMTEMIRQKAEIVEKHNRFRGNEFHVVDWARKAEAELFENDISTQAGFLKHFLPHQYVEETEKVEEILEEHMVPAISDLEDDVRQIRNETMPENLRQKKLEARREHVPEEEWEEFKEEQGLDMDRKQRIRALIEDTVGNVGRLREFRKSGFEEKVLDDTISEMVANNYTLYDFSDIHDSKLKKHMIPLIELIQDTVELHERLKEEDISTAELEHLESTVKELRTVREELKQVTT